MQTEKIYKNLVLKNATIIDPFKSKEMNGDLYIKEGKINSIGKATYPSSSKIIDCTDRIVTHGFCDIHVHFREPGEEYKEDLSSGSQAALGNRTAIGPSS